MPFNPFPHNPESEKQRAFENIVRKGENAGYQYFLLFLTMFFHPIKSDLSLVRAKISLFRNELKVKIILKMMISYCTVWKKYELKSK